MPLFRATTKTVQEARQDIADTIGASAKSGMLTRAGRSLDAALQYFNAYRDWEWLKTEADPTTVVAPFSVTGISATANQTSANVAGLQSLDVDDFIEGSGFQPGTRITSTANATAIGFNFAITADTDGSSATATRDRYALPSDFRKVYTARLLVSQRPLYPKNRRLYDRLSVNEFETTNAPRYYDIFHVGELGKIGILDPPGQADVLQLRYFRAMTISTATGDALDIPVDYEFSLISWAKWHFLTDKGQGRLEQAQTWLQLATDGLSRLTRDQNRQPDRSIGFQSGHTMGPHVTDNSVYFTEDGGY